VRFKIIKANDDMGNYIWLIVCKHCLLQLCPTCGPQPSQRFCAAQFRLSL